MNPPTMSSRVRRQITDRDISVMRSLFDARILTVQHLADIHFAGSYEAARKRVMKLKADRWISERPRERVFDSAILHLTKKGFTYLKQNGHLSDFPAIGWKQMEKRVQVSPLTLQHELAVADVQASFYRGVRQETRLRIAEFKTWPRLFSFTTTRTFPGGYTKPITIRPDGYITICRDDGVFGESQFYFYLEVDRSTETVDNIVRRLQSYATYYRTGGFAAAHGGTTDRPELYPFRTLLVCTSMLRREYLSRAIAKTMPEVRQSVLLAVQSELRCSAIEDAWRSPNECVSDNGVPLII